MIDRDTVYNETVQYRPRFKRDTGKGDSITYCAEGKIHEGGIELIFLNIKNRMHNNEHCQPVLARYICMPQPQTGASGINYHLQDRASEFVLFS